MKYFPLMFLFLTSCTQSFVSYVKKVPAKPIISLEDILAESGVVSPSNVSQKNIMTNIHPTGSLVSNSNKKIKKVVNTREVEAGTIITITADTESYLVAQLYYSGEQIIQNFGNSNLAQGIFEFMIGNKSGEIKIRLYHPQSGALVKEMTWYIEVKNPSK
ncbi:MAG: hypothetical protein ACRCS8_06160 [Brevinema sp.]